LGKFSKLFLSVNVDKLKPAATMWMQVDFPSVYLLIPLLGVFKIAGWVFILLADILMSVKGGTFIANLLVSHGAVSVNPLLAPFRKAEKRHYATLNNIEHL